MTKIAFIIDTIESPTAGTEKQLLLLIRHLDRSRYQPYLCVLRSSPWLRQEFTDAELVEIGFLSFKRASSYVNLIRFALFLKREGIDIVQTHFVDGNKIGIVAAKLAGVRAIVSTRRNQGYWHSGSEVLILRLLNRFVTRFLANSESTRQWAGKTEGLALERTAVIYNALETERYGQRTAGGVPVVKQELGLAPESAVVGIVANLRPVKGVDVFIRAASVIAQTRPDVFFVVIGEGPERQALERLTAELVLGARVYFLGRRTDIPEILRGLDVGVLSSYSESFSNSIVEYLAAGLPVVCTDVGGAREAVDDGRNGYLVQAGDHAVMADRIRVVLESGEILLLGQESRKKAVEMFSLPAIIQQYSLFYDEVTGV